MPKKRRFLVLDSKWKEEERLELYVERVTTAIETGNFMYVAHPDILHYVGNAEIYDKHMRGLAKALKEHNMPVEINLNGYVEKKQYPNEPFVKIAVQEGCEFLIGVDAHRPEAMADIEKYEECIQWVEALGGDVFWK